MTASARFRKLPIPRPRLSLERLALFAAAAVLGALLFVPPFVGVANNGDFERIMGTVGLADAVPDESPADRYFRYFHRTYKLQGLGLGGYVSSEIPVVLAATLLNRLLYSSHTFDIRFLGAVYAVLFLTALHALLRALRPAPAAARAALAALFIPVFCDIGYVAYYHSLFGEPAILAFLLLTVGLALGLARSAGRPSAALLAAFFASAACLAAAKTQTAPVGLLLALLGCRFRRLRGDRRWRRTWLWGTALLTLAAAGIYVAAPKEFKAINQYQSVFNGVLHGSADPARDLGELGIDPRLAVLAGTNYFTERPPIAPDDPLMAPMFYDRISHLRIALFYMAHPARLLDNLRCVADNAMMIRPAYLGNYERSAAFAPGTLSMKFAWWSEWKKTALPHSLTFFALFFGGCAALLAFYRRRSQPLPVRLAAETLLAVELIAACAFLTPLIGDGLSDIGKHLFLFNACFDLLAVGAGAWLIHLALAAVRQLRARIEGRGPLREGSI
jgi:hypothetical protein